MEVQNFARSIDSSYFEAVPVQKAAYSVGRLVVMRVAATAEKKVAMMAVKKALSLVVVRV